MAKGVWGIDVSRYSVKAVRLEKGRDSVFLTDLEVIPYKVSGRIEEAELEVRIREALKDLRITHRIGSEKVVISIPTHSAYNRIVKLPPVEDPVKAIQYEAQQQIPFGLDQVVWGYQMVERQYAPSEEKEVILLALKREIVENFLNNIEEIGLNVDTVQLSAVALYNFLAYDQDVGSPVVVLEMGADNAALLVLESERFWIRSLPIAGNDLTKALQEQFRIPFDKAEALKVNALQSPQVEQIYETIVPVYKNIVSEIHRSLGYYKSVSKQAKFDRILLLGNATKALNFQRFMGQALQIQAARIQKLNKIGLGTGIDPQVLNNNLNSIGTALGLALQGLELTKNRVNLLPESYQRKRQIKKKYPLVAAGIAALYATLIYGVVTTNDNIEKLRKNHDEIVKADRAARDQLVQFERVTNLQGLDKELELFNDLGADRSITRDVLDMVLKNFPKNGDPAVQDKDKIWLRGLRVDVYDGERPGPGGFPPATARPVSAKRAVNVVLDVVITKYEVDRVHKNTGPQRNPVAGQNFVNNKLNIGAWKFKDAAITSVTVAHVKEVDGIMPTEGSGGEGPGGGGGDPKFYHYSVKFTLDVAPDGGTGATASDGKDAGKVK